MFLELPRMGDPLATPLLSAFGFVPVVAGWLREKTKYGIHVHGPSGTLKSVVCRALQALYGPDFSTEPLMSWTGTPYSLQSSGHGFKDALAVVDDYKVSTFQNPQAIQAVIQNYADGAARSRLDRASKLLPTVPFRGWLVSNGEDPLDGSASSTARILPLQWNPVKCGQQLVDRLRSFQKRFSGFTREFVGYLQELGIEKVRDVVDQFSRRGILGGSANGPRLAEALALNRASFVLASRCAHERLGALDSAELEELKSLYSRCEESWCHSLELRVGELEPGALFLHLLRDCIASTPGLVLRGNDTGRDSIGFVKGDALCLFWEKAFAAVRDLAGKSGNPFPLSGTAVLADLDRTRNIKRGRRDRIRTQVRRGGLRVQVVRIPVSVVGLSPDNSLDTEDDDEEGAE